MTPLISVVISVYNDEKHLQRSISSLLEQTFVDFEIVIINDGSIDSSRSILDDYSRRDNRLRVVHRENRGLTQSLIEGCELARGGFIARQDGDDLSSPTRLRKQLDLLQSNSNLGFVSCFTDYIDDQDQLVDHIEREIDSDKATQALLHDRQGPPAHGSVMFRRDLYEKVGGYRSCFYYGQDSDLWLRMGAFAKLAYCPETLYKARISPQGISSRTSDLQSQFGELGQASHAARMRGEEDSKYISAAEELTSLIRSKKLHLKQDPKLQAAAHYRIGTRLWRLRNKAARTHFSEAIRLDPWNWKARARLLSTYFGKPNQS